MHDVPNPACELIRFPLIAFGAPSSLLCRRISGVDVSTQRVENAEKGDQPGPENDAENSCNAHWRVLVAQARRD